MAKNTKLRPICHDPAECFGKQGKWCNILMATYPAGVPCPFCGWGTIVNGGFLNYRCQCNACGATTKGYPTWEMAMEAWNRRATDENNNSI